MVKSLVQNFLPPHPHPQDRVKLFVPPLLKGRIYMRSLQYG